MLRGVGRWLLSSSHGTGVGENQCPSPALLFSCEAEDLRVDNPSSGAGPVCSRVSKEGIASTRSDLSLPAAALWPLKGRGRGWGDAWQGKCLPVRREQHTAVTGGLSSGEVSWEREIAVLQSELSHSVALDRVVSQELCCHCLESRTAWKEAPAFPVL